MNPTTQPENLFELPATACPHCDFIIEFTSAATGKNPGPAKVGTIMVCSGCAKPSKLSQHGLVKMSTKAMNALDKSTKAALARTILMTTLQIRADKAQNQGWGGN